MGSVDVVPRFQNTSPTVVLYGLSCSTECGIPPGPGIEPMSSALVDSSTLSHQEALCLIFDPTVQHVL